jgi:LacI family transcriptional regulator
MPASRRTNGNGSAASGSRGAARPAETTPPRRAVERRVAIVHTNDPGEAFDLCRGVAAYRPAGGPWRLQSLPIHNPGDRRVARRLLDVPCDGMIMMPGHARVLAPLRARGVPVVDVEGPPPDQRHPAWPRVHLDDVHIGRLAGEHLLDRGFARFLFLGFDAYWSRDRGRGLAEVARRAGGAYHASYTAVWAELISETWIREQLRRATHPVAVMGCNDIVAARAIDVAEAQGWAVPTRMAVLGVDDRITECIRVQPPLSSIPNERYRAGFEAARLLDAQFAAVSGGGAARAGAAAPMTWLRPERVIERESTSSHAYADADVVDALEFIRRDACRGISVDDVADRVNLSRSTLERRFRRLVGRSPGHELRRVRLDAVKRALEQTRAPVAHIAAACGFASLSSLSHCFRAATGMSPEAYRRPTRDGRPLARPG